MGRWSEPTCRSSLLVVAGCIELPPSAASRFVPADGGGDPAGGGGAGAEGVGGGDGGGAASDGPLPICPPGEDPADGCATITQLAPGDTHSCLLASDGHVWCWGSNFHGELGNPALPKVSHVSPHLVPELDGVTQLEAGRHHTCALVGTDVYCWGDNYFAELGDETRHQRDRPTKIAHEGTFKQVSTRMRTTCVLSVDDEVHCWGFRLNGQPSNGTQIDVPAQRVEGLDDLDGIAAIEIGSEHACAISSDHSEMRCWGVNSQGSLGDGTGIDSVAAVAVGDALVTPVDHVATANEFTCARVGQPAQLQCWGHFNEITGENHLAPMSFTTSSELIRVDVGWRHVCSHDGDGFVRCIGQSFFGELGPTVGIGQTSVSPAPVVGSVALFASGWQHNCAVLTSGQLVCWGHNSRGQVDPESVDDVNVDVPATVSFDETRAAP